MDPHSFESLWGNDSSSDITFNFPIKAHRQVLATKSEYFKAMFKSGMSDSSSRDIPMDHSNPVSFQLFLQFLYCDFVEVSQLPEHFHELYRLGLFYGVPTLCQYLFDNANLDTMLCAAETYVSSCTPVVSPNFERMVGENLSLVKEETLKGLSTEAASVLLQIAAARWCSAMACFDFVVKWAKANDQSNPSIVWYIPFECMGAEQFGEVEESGLFPPDVLAELRKRISRDWKSIFTSSGKKFEKSCDNIYGLATDLASNVVHVADCNAHKIHVFHGNSGKLAFSLETDGSDPAGIAISKSGKIFVSDWAKHRVLVFDGTTRKIVGSFGSKSSGPGQLKVPNGVCFDELKSEVHVCNQGLHCVTVFSEDGHFVRNYGKENLKWPSGVAVEGELRHAFVVDVHFAHVLMFSTEDGSHLCSFGPESAMGSAVSWKSVAVSKKSGHVVVAEHNLSESGSKSIKLFRRGGEFIGWVSRFVEVRAVAFGANDELFVGCGDRGSWEVFRL